MLDNTVKMPVTNNSKPLGCPGCWGSIIAHNLDTNECSSCEFKKSCGEEAVRRRPKFIEMLKKRDDYLGKGGALLKPYGIKTKNHVKTARDIKKEEIENKRQDRNDRFAELVSFGMPQKAARSMAALEKLGADFSLIRRGVNPLYEIKSYPHIKDALDRLLRDGFVDHRILTVEWCEQFGWGRTTANSMASQFTSICKMLTDYITVEDTISTLNNFEKEVAA